MVSSDFTYRRLQLTRSDVCKTRRRCCALSGNYPAGSLSLTVITDSSGGRSFTPQQSRLVRAPLTYPHRCPSAHPRTKAEECRHSQRQSQSVKNSAILVSEGRKRIIIIEKSNLAYQHRQNIGVSYLSSSAVSERLDCSSAWLWPWMCSIDTIRCVLLSDGPHCVRLPAPMAYRSRGWLWKELQWKTSLIFTCVACDRTRSYGNKVVITNNNNNDNDNNALSI